MTYHSHASEYELLSKLSWITSYCRSYIGVEKLIIGVFVQENPSQRCVPLKATIRLL